MEPVTVSIPVVPVVSILLGLMLLLWVIWPLATQLILASSHGKIVTPIADNFVTDTQASEVDLTKVSNWSGKNRHKTYAPVYSYLRTLPKLRINKAVVKIGSEDLDKSLIHYGGTGIPGTYGTAVIFGHSILRQFYDPRNYISIFSTLSDLKKGDNIFVNFDGVDYRYQVLEWHTVGPDDISGLEQRFDSSYLALVTCFPAGTYLERLWLTARLVPFSLD